MGCLSQGYERDASPLKISYSSREGKLEKRESSLLGILGKKSSKIKRGVNYYPYGYPMPGRNVADGER